MFRDLFQTDDPGEVITMSDSLHLIIAIGVFSLMIIGLILTIYEFREHVVEDQGKKDQTFHGDKVEHKFKGVVDK